MFFFLFFLPASCSCWFSIFLSEFVSGSLSLLSLRFVFLLFLVFWLCVCLALFLFVIFSINLCHFSYFSVCLAFFIFPLRFFIFFLFRSCSFSLFFLCLGFMFFSNFSFSLPLAPVVFRFFFLFLSLLSGYLAFSSFLFFLLSMYLFSFSSFP